MTDLVYIDPDAIPVSWYLTFYHARNGDWTARMSHLPKSRVSTCFKARATTLQAALDDLKQQMNEKVQR